MAFESDAHTGKRFGRYEVICKLAMGGSAEIFLGFARTGPFVGLPLVLKRMLASKDDIDALADLIDEAKVTASLSHPNIARIYDIAQTKDDVVLVIEFIPGATLNEVRRVRKKRGERSPLGFTYKVIADALLGLHHAHAHTDAKGRVAPIVHRDVTPANLMVDFRGDCRLLDFGLARFIGAARRTAVDVIRGTAAYMSPEQIRNHPLDPRSDLFAMGAILYELITGSVAFGRANDEAELDAVLGNQVVPPAMRMSGVPLWLDALVMKALDPKPERRFSSALKFRTVLLERAKDEVWSAQQCAAFLRRDFAEREGSAGELLQMLERQDDEPTQRATPRDRKSNTRSKGKKK